MSAYIKALLAVAVSAGGAIATSFEGDDSITIAEGIGVAIFVLGSGGVTYLVSKTAAGKAIVGALSATLASLSAAIITDGVVATQEWVTAVVAGLSALALVYQIPNSEPTP